MDVEILQKLHPEVKLLTIIRSSKSTYFIATPQLLRKKNNNEITVLVPRTETQNENIVSKLDTTAPITPIDADQIEIKNDVPKNESVKETANPLNMLAIAADLRLSQDDSSQEKDIIDIYEYTR
jgi:hypothetical protein